MFPRYNGSNSDDCPDSDADCKFTWNQSDCIWHHYGCSADYRYYYTSVWNLSFVVADVAKISVSDVTKEALRYLPAMVVVLLLIIFLPQTVTFLPSIMM